MKFIALVFILLLQTLVAKNDGPTVTVPSSLSSCASVPLEINGGTPPYSVSIVDASHPNGPALHEYTDVRQPSSMKWNSNLTAGTVITFNVEDSKGMTATSDKSTVSTDCRKPAQNEPAFSAAVTPNNLTDATPPPPAGSNASAPVNTGTEGSPTPNPVDVNGSSPPPTDPAATGTPATGTPVPGTPATGTNTPSQIGGANTSIANTSTKSPSQPLGGNSTNSKSINSTQTAKPSSENRPPPKSASSKGLSTSINSVAFITFLVTLSSLI